MSNAVKPSKGRNELLTPLDPRFIQCQSTAEYEWLKPLLKQWSQVLITQVARIHGSLDRDISEPEGWHSARQVAGQLEAAACAVGGIATSLASGPDWEKLALEVPDGGLTTAMLGARTGPLGELAKWLEASNRALPRSPAADTDLYFRVVAPSWAVDEKAPDSRHSAITKRLLAQIDSVASVVVHHPALSIRVMDTRDGELCLPITCMLVQEGRTEKTGLDV